jgi:hypothetical protein
MKRTLAVLATVGLLAAGCGKGSPFGPAEKDDEDIPRFGHTQGDGDMTVNLAVDHSTINVNSGNDNSTARK